ncbi:MAG: hypothetical protein ACOY9Y_02755 [Bacillota bacterium]
MKEVRLIKTLEDLKDLSLLEEESLTEAEIQPLREELQRLAREEFDPYLATNRIERDNIRAAQVHEMLSFLVIRSLLNSRAQFAGDGALFWQALREVESLFEQREEIYVPDLPAEALRPVTRDLLFDCQVPSVGEIANLSVSRVLARTAIDAASRMADSMKVKKSEFRVEAVLARLQREAEIRRRQVH